MPARGFGDMTTSVMLIAVENRSDIGLSGSALATFEHCPFYVLWGSRRALSFAYIFKESFTHSS